MEETRTTLLSDIIDWTRSDSDKTVFWLRGIPGSGKSTVAQTIAQHPESQKILASHIFFKRENTRRHNILELVAYRIGALNKEAALQIASRLHRPRSTLHDSFVNLILEPLKEAEKSGNLQEPIVIILDALDEYGTSESRVPLMQLIKNEFSKLPRKVRFLITSRPEADLVRAMKSQEHINEIELEHNTESGRRDVSAYIAAEMKQLVPAKASQDGSWEEKMDIFSRAADGLFIWASVAIKLVRSSKKPYKKICDLAGSEAKLTLDELYRTALLAAELDWEDEEDRQLFSLLFALILPNRGSLTIELLDLLLGFEGDSSELTLFKLQSFISYSVFGPVQLHHKTLADFLQAKERAPSEPWYIDMPRENLVLVEWCFLALKELYFDIYGLVAQSVDSELGIRDIPPHMRYAALYWIEHLRHIEISPEVLERLRAFLSEKLLFWFEILSLLKEFSRVASQALLQAINWVSVSIF